MKNISKKIYLQVGEDSDSDDFDKIKLNCDVTWCWERINENDLVFEYRSKGEKKQMNLIIFTLIAFMFGFTLGIIAGYGRSEDGIKEKLLNNANKLIEQKKETK